MTEPLIIITGPPGVGKSTAARTVAETFDKGALVAGDEFHRSLVSGAIPPHLPESHDQNVMLIDITMQTAASYAAGGWVTVLEGIIGPWFLEPARRAAAQVGAPLHYVVLDADLETCIARFVDRERDDGRLDVVQKMHGEFRAHPMPGHVIDASPDPATVAATVLAAFESGRLLL